MITKADILVLLAKCLLDRVCVFVEGVSKENDGRAGVSIGARQVKLVRKGLNEQDDDDDDGSDINHVNLFACDAFKKFSLFFFRFALYTEYNNVFYSLLGQRQAIVALNIDELFTN